MNSLAFETASWLRRIAALFVDWTVCTFVVIGVVGFGRYSEPGSTAQLYTFGVYLLEASILTSLVGGSFGQIATRLRVVSVPHGGPVPFPRSVLRHFLVLLVIPPVVFKPDGRGLHDLAAGSATVTLQTWRQLTGRPPI